LHFPAVSQDWSYRTISMRNYICISAWEIFGSHIEQTADSSDFSDVTSLPFLSAASFGSFHCIPLPLSAHAGGRRAPPRGRSLGHTWAPSHPPRGILHGGTMGTHADSTTPSGPAALIWSRGNQQVNNVSFLFAASILCPCADTPMRLIASHGPAQSLCLTIVIHWTTIMVTGFHHRDNQDPVKDLRSALLIYVS
jgi:hypothetical protein